MTVKRIKALMERRAKMKRQDRTEQAEHEERQEGANGELMTRNWR